MIFKYQYLFLFVILIHWQGKECKTTVHMSFKMNSYNPNEQESSYYYPSQFVQYQPVRNPNGLFLLTVDRNGGAMMHPIITSENKTPIVYISLESPKSINQKIYNHCQITDKTVTFECQWGFLSGRRNAKLQSMANTNYLDILNYASTYNANYHHLDNREQNRQSGFFEFDLNSQPAPWYHKKPNVMSPQHPHKSNSKINHYDTHANDDAATVKTNMPGLVDMLRDQINKLIEKIPEDADDTYNKLRYRLNLLVIRLLKFSGFISRRVGGLLQKAAIRLKERAYYGKINTFTLSNSSSTDATMKAYNFWSTCPTKLDGFIDMDLDVSSIVYAEVIGLSRRCVNSELILIDRHNNSNKLKYKQSIQTECPRTLFNRFCLTGVAHFNENFVKNCISFNGTKYSNYLPSMGFMFHVINFASLNNNKDRHKCSKIGAINYKDDIVIIPRNLNKINVIIYLIKNAPVPKIVRLTFKSKKPGKKTISFDVESKNTNVIESHLDWENEFDPSYFPIITNYMIPIGNYDQSISWHLMTLQLHTKTVNYYNYLITVFSKYESRPHFTLQASINNVELDFNIESMILVNEIKTQEFPTGNGNEWMFVWQQTVASDKELGHAHNLVAKCSHCKFHVAELTCLTTGSLQNINIYDANDISNGLIFIDWFERFRMLKMRYKYLINFGTKLIELNQLKRSLTTTHMNQFQSQLESNMAKIRNIGIIAHIDAGKTTTTERMLYYSGQIINMGDVDKGDTVTDYMEQERERGITITSASVRFDWLRHHINLIDTPGHVDFIFEVERCLSVLDAAVVILDASAGVEAQTNTVWQQANNYDIPKLVYLNKMDKPRANVDLCMKDLERLDCQPLLIQFPVFATNGQYNGLIDLITMEKKIWNLDHDKFGELLSCAPLTSNDGEVYEKSLKLREKIIGTISDYDDKFGELILQSESLEQLSNLDIINALRRCTIRNQIVPVTTGSSFKNIGVQPLMDSVVKFFPSPLEKNHSLFGKYQNKELNAFAFKVIFHPNFGPLTFVRVFSGQLKSNSKIFNSTRNLYEKINKIFVPFADSFKEITCVEPGIIVALSGPNQTYTGDFLVQSRESSQKLITNLNNQKESLTDCEKLIVNGIKIPAPVFFCSVEAPSMSRQKDLEIALERLQKEDPSFTVNVNEETKQMILNGMGELHIDIIKNRIQNEYKLDAFFGKLQISYRESIDEGGEYLLTENKQIKNIRNSVTIGLRLVPCDPDQSSSAHKVKVIKTAENGLHLLRFDRLNAIENGVKTFLDNGCLLGFPLINCRAELFEFNCTYTTLQSFVFTCAQKCLAEAFKLCKPYLLEPIMKLKITAPESMYGTILKDLNNRRSTIEQTDSKNNQIILTSLTPLSELTGFSSDLRKLTSGKANLTMQLDNYQRMAISDQDRLCQQFNSYI